MASQLFNNPGGRGGTEIKGITFAQLYRIVMARLDHLQDDFDPDATCQQVCVEVEKAMGIFPNIGSPTGRLTKSEPEMQNLPMNTKEGRIIRAAFVK